MGERLPEIGRIVRYRVRADDTEEIRSNHASTLPAIIVAVFEGNPDELVNLQVFCDGSRSTCWMTSVKRGNGPGQWRWPQAS